MDFSSFGFYYTDHSTELFVSSTTEADSTGQSSYSQGMNCFVCIYICSTNYELDCSLQMNH